MIYIPIFVNIVLLLLFGYRYLFFSLFSARLRPQGLFFCLERWRWTSAMAGKEKYARQPERKIFPRPHGQNAGIGRNGNRRLPLLKNPIPRGRTAENGRAATRGMDRKGLKTGGWKNRKGRSEVKKGRRMAMPSIKRDYAVGRAKLEQTLPGPPVRSVRGLSVNIVTNHELVID